MWFSKISGLQAINLVIKHIHPKLISVLKKRKKYFVLSNQWKLITFLIHGCVA